MDTKPVIKPNVIADLSQEPIINRKFYAMAEDSQARLSGVEQRLDSLENEPKREDDTFWTKAGRFMKDATPVIALIVLPIVAERAFGVKIGKFFKSKGKRS